MYVGGLRGASEFMVRGLCLAVSRKQSSTVFHTLEGKPCGVRSVMSAT